MRTIALLAAASLTLISCRDERPEPMPAPPPHAGGETCDASGAQTVVGRAVTPASIATAKRLSGAGVVRVLRPGQMMTMEYRGDRVNLDTDTGHTIIGIRCG